MALAEVCGLKMPTKSVGAAATVLDVNTFQHLGTVLDNSENFEIPQNFDVSAFDVHL